MNINSTFGSKNGSKNGSKIASLLGVMCYAQDNSIELSGTKVLNFQPALLA